MLITFVFTLVIITLLMLVFFIRSYWGGKKDIFYLAKQARNRLYKDMQPNTSNEDYDQTVQRMFDLLSGKIKK
jgi:TM2 domain-containing membrane protein YozV